MVDSESSPLRECACTVNPPRPATLSAGDLHLFTTMYLITRGKTVVAKALSLPFPRIYTLVLTLT